MEDKTEENTNDTQDLLCHSGVFSYFTTQQCSPGLCHIPHNDTVYGEILGEMKVYPDLSGTSHQRGQTGLGVCKGTLKQMSRPVLLRISGNYIVLSESCSLTSP